MSHEENAVKNHNVEFGICPLKSHKVQLIGNKPKKNKNFIYEEIQVN